MPENKKYCIVPDCPSSTTATPNRRFVTVPMKEPWRSEWLKAVRTKNKYSSKSTIFVCEDHFDLEKDAENWFQIRFNVTQRMRVKRSVVPHIFECQPSRKCAQQSLTAPVKSSTAKGVPQQLSQERDADSPRISSPHEGIVPVQQPLSHVAEREIVTQDRNTHKAQLTSTTSLNSDNNAIVKEETISDEEEGDSQEKSIFLATPLKIDHQVFEYQNNTDCDNYNETPNSNSDNQPVVLIKEEKIEEEEPCESRQTGSQSPSEGSSFLPNPQRARRPIQGIFGMDFSDNEEDVCGDEENVCASFSEETNVVVKTERDEPEASVFNEVDSTLKTSPRLVSAHPGDEATDFGMSFGHFLEPALMNHPFSSATQGDDLESHENTEPYGCEVSQKVFWPNGNLQFHQKTHTKEKPFECDQCEKSFSEKRSLVIHKRLHSGEKPFACDECDQSYSRKDLLQYHKQSHTNKRPFQCDVCEKRFSKRGNLYVHLRSHSGLKEYECDECDAKYSRKSSLKIHQRLHTGEKPFECDECTQRFSKKSKLIIHKRTHSGEKPFSCDECDQRYSRKDLLKNHKQSHTASNKPFECDVCKQRFSRKSNLNAHLRSHHSEQTKFECNECGAKFTRTNSLKTHQRSHTGEKPFECDICKKVFSRRENLTAHIRLHSGEKPFECGICKRRFLQRKNLTAHLRSHHE